jgi:AP-4 complex subunit beta-1
MSYSGQIHTATPVQFPSTGPPGAPSANGGGGGGGGGGGPAGAAVPDSYFTESRKGEVNELRTLLRNFATERDPQRKRDIIKKVIAYMTLGIDVSRLFTEMMLAIETRDLVIKKMVYLYLCNYAYSHPELAQMCTNSLQKDCANEDPMVRGLALRSLCSLNLPQMVEYISEPLRKSLTDHHAYVRKTGVMGILKLYHLDKESFEQCNFVDILYDMLRDPDSSVVSNAILVLNEIMVKSENGGMAINRAIMLHLLNRIHEFAEFGVVQVLELVPRYIPANADEGFQIMNLLDPVLRTSSCAAVMATIRAFLSMADQIASDDPLQMKRQVIDRIKAPLITLVSSGSAEMEYCLLKQVQALVELCPGAFDDEYRQFYTRYHEPTHVKYLKVEILPMLSNPDTAPDIVAELAELVNHTDTRLSRLAMRSMARIACRDTGGPGCSESIAQRMVEMLDYNIDHIQAEAASALTLMIRKHASLKEFASLSLVRTLKYVQEPHGKASIIFLLSECGDVVQEAPYALEKLIDNYETIQDTAVKHTLLNATMKLFFQRPPEVQRMLGRLLLKATDDVTSQDLHDRALLYYRLLKCGADPKTILGQIVSTNTVISKEDFCENDDAVTRQELMEEFNTLAIVYGKASLNFIAPDFQVNHRKMPDDHPLEDQMGASEGHVPMAPQALPQPTGLHEDPNHQETSLMDGGGYDQPAAAAAPAPVSDMIGDLLGFDMPTPAAAAPTPTPASRIALASAVTMTGEDYQAKWGAIADADSIVSTAALSSVPPSTDVVESALGSINVFTMASGELPNEFKFFLYAQDSESQSLFLIQSNIGKQDAEPLMILTCKVTGSDKASDQRKVDQLMELVQSVLG